MKPYIDRSFWSDSDIEALPPAGKLVMLWLITNPQTSNLGICSATEKRFHFETGLPVEELQRAVEALPKSLQRVGSAIFVRNFIRHQFGAGPSLTKNNFFRSLSQDFHRAGSEIQNAIQGEYEEFRSLTPKPLPRGCEGVEKPEVRLLAKEREEGGTGETATEPEPPNPEHAPNLNPPPQQPAISAGDPVRDALRQNRPFVAAWLSWKQHLADLARTMTRGQENSILTECGRQGPDRAIEVIEFSISKGAKNLIWDDAPRKRKPGTSRTSIPQDPVGWAAWRDENYPGADKNVPFSQVSDDVRREFEKSQQP
jgi:hypothetical protein